LVPILSRFLKRVVGGQVAGTPDEKRVESMIAALDVVAMLQLCKVKDRVDQAQLMAAIVKHLNVFIEVYGEDMIKPKHHYALHLPGQLFRFGVLLATLVLERKHRAFKRYARGRNNLSNFETGVSQEVLCHNLWELCHKHSSAYSTSNPTKKQT
jgi:hypothetical protein